MTRQGIGWWAGLAAVVVPMATIGTVVTNNLGEHGQQGWRELPMYLLPWATAFVYILATRPRSTAELVTWVLLAVFAGFFAQDRIEEAVGSAWWTAIPRTAVMGLVLLPVLWLRYRFVQSPSSRRA